MNINTEAEPRWVQNKDRILHSFFSLLRISVILLYVYVVLYVILRDDDENVIDSRIIRTEVLVGESTHTKQRLKRMLKARMRGESELPFSEKSTLTS